MSDPFQDVSNYQEVFSSKEAKLAKFRKEEFTNYIPATEEEAARRDDLYGVQPTVKTIKNSKAAKTKAQAPSRKTPATKPDDDQSGAPVRKSPRGHKRKSEASKNDDEDSPTLRSKKVKTASADLAAGNDDDGLTGISTDGYNNASTSLMNDEHISPAARTSTGRKRRMQSDAFDGANDDAPSSKKSKTTPASQAQVSGAPASKTKQSPTLKLKKLAPTPGSDKPLKGRGKARAMTPDDSEDRSEVKPYKGKGKARATTPDDYDDRSEAEEMPAAKKSAKKQSSLELEMIEFGKTAKPSGNGTAQDRPNFATLDEPWKCANRSCNSGMTYRPRNAKGDSNSVGRKVTSHFFGRNKKETGYIHDEVWGWFCRKCYQRAGYTAKVGAGDDNNQGPSNLMKEHIRNLRNQIVRLQIWRPEARFKVQLLKEATQRLGNYHKVLQKPGKTEADAIEAVEFVPQKKANGKETQPQSSYVFPIKSIEHFEYNFAGEQRTYADLEAVCDWVDQLNETGDAPCDPPVEFLISAEAEGETVNDPTGSPDNYDRWVRWQDGEAQDDDDGDEEEDEIQAADDETIDMRSEDEDAGAPDVDIEDSDDDETDDEEPPFRSSHLKITPLGRKVGLKGKEGIVRGSGLKVDVEKKHHDDMQKRLDEVEDMERQYQETKQRLETMQRLEKEEKERKDAAKELMEQVEGSSPPRVGSPAKVKDEE